MDRPHIQANLTLNGGDDTRLMRANLSKTADNEPQNEPRSNTETVDEVIEIKNHKNADTPSP